MEKSTSSLKMAKLVTFGTLSNYNFFFEFSFRYGSDGRKRTHSIKSSLITKDKFKVLKIENTHNGNYFSEWTRKAIDITVEMTPTWDRDNVCAQPVSNGKFLTLLNEALSSLSE